MHGGISIVGSSLLVLGIVTAGAAAEPSAGADDASAPLLLINSCKPGHDTCVGGLFLVRPDATQTAVAGDVPGEQLHADWTRDGRSLVYEQTTGAPISPYITPKEIRIVPIDGSAAPAVLAACAAPPCLMLETPAVSPDGTEVAYLRNDVQGAIIQRTAVEIVTLASGETRTVAQADTPTFLSYPRWSPDGKRLVLEVEHWSDPSDSADLTGSTIAVVDAAGPADQPIEEITDPALFGAYPDWSRDDRIVFGTYGLNVFDGSEPSELFTVAPDGTEVQQLTHLAADGIRPTQPTWTPDGTAIVVTAVASGDRTAGLVIPGIAGVRPLTTTHATHSRLQPVP